jgi:chromosome segregation ATPase
MRALLDQTRRDLSSARSGLEDSKRRYQNIQLDSQQVTSQLDSSQREVQALKGALYGSSGREASKDARMEFEKKKADVVSHVAKVKMLEGKLAENREQLSDMSMKIANMHNEARDKEIAARRCEDLQADLQRKLDAHQRMKTAAFIEIEAGEGQVSRAEKAHNQAKTWWEELEAAVAKDSKDSAEAALLAKDIEVKREQLAKARQDVQELVGACEELDTTAITRRAVLGERQDALDVAKARVEELSRQLAQANSEIVGSDGMLKGLEQDAAECLANIEDAKRRLKQKQDDASQFEINTTKAADLEKTRGVELEKTVDALRIEIENASNGSLTAQQVSAVVGYSSIEETGPLADLVSAKADCEREVKVLSEENEAILSELKAGTAQQNSLEQTSLTHASDLETTRGKITSKLREVADLEAAYKKDILQMEADQAALETQKEESHRLHKQLTEELEEERLKRNGKLDSISKARQQKALLDSALEKALAERAASVGKGEDTLMSTEARLKILTNGFGESSKRAETNASRLASADRTRSDLGLKLATITEELSSGEDMLQETMTCLSAKKSEFDSLQEDLKKGQGDSSNGDIQSQRLQSEISILEAKLKPLEAAAGDLQSLEESHRDLSEQLRVDGDRHKELMTIRSRELDNTRTQIEQQRNLMLQQKDTEIQSQITQIDPLENEKSSLTQQVERLAMEKQSFTDNSTKHEKSYGDYAMEQRMKSKEGDVLEGTVREMKALSNQLEEKEGELQRTLATVQTREGLLRSEAQESLAQLGEVRRKMESADAQAQRLLEAEVKNLEQQREVLIQHKVEKETLNKEMEDLKAAEAKALEESQAITAKTDEIGHTLLQAKSAFAETTAERERCHLQMLETSKKVKALQGEKEQRMSGARQASAAKNSALELEEQLQQASDGLAEAQELLRDRKREEEELRQEIQKLQEQVRATQDKMAYQMEHSDLQYETIQQLEDERKRVESETEDLTIRLHDAEQQKEHMQNQNLLLQQQVEGLDRGALQEWADQVPRPHASAEEVARYTDELEATKARVEALTQMKKEELDKVKAEHQDTCNRLRDRITKVQAQIEVTEARFEKREADRAKKDQREMVDAPSSAVPGLVVPQRPLPANAGRRKALLVGINYATSHAPLKGCINDVWNLQCLLRYTMQYQAEQLNLLLDGADGTPPRKESAPTKANILAGLQWLINGARPGDSLMFVFCGYGTQHPRSPGSDQNEAYLVPSDFAADLPSDFFHTHKAQAATARSSHAGTPMGTPIVPSRGPTTSRGAGPLDMTQDGGGEERGPGYRLVSLIELQDVLAKVPPAVRITLVFDCCYSLVPNLHPKQSFVITFPKVERGPDESAKLRDSLSRPRFLQLPVLPVRHTPRHLRASVFPGCWVYSFSACGLQEWCAEFPIEGTVQGAFTWAFLKAFAACHFHCSVYQMMRMLTKILTELRTHFKRIEQTPTLLHSQSAGMNDIVLGT